MSDAILLRGGGEKPIHMWKKYEVNTSTTYTWNRWNLVSTTIYKWNKWNAVTTTGVYETPGGSGSGSPDTAAYNESAYVNAFKSTTLPNWEHVDNNHQGFYGTGYLYGPMSKISTSTTSFKVTGWTNEECNVGSPSTSIDRWFRKLIYNPTIYRVTADYVSYDQVYYITAYWTAEKVAQYGTTTVKGSTSYGQITSTSSSAYPSNGASGSYWYISSGSAVQYSKGSTKYTDVSSTSSSAYPNNGHDGSYWYNNKQTVVNHSMGNYIEDVFSLSQDTYPANGIAGSYWYVYQGQI